MTPQDPKLPNIDSQSKNNNKIHPQRAATSGQPWERQDDEALHREALRTRVEANSALPRGLHFRAFFMSETLISPYVIALE